MRYSEAISTAGSRREREYVSNSEQQLQLLLLARVCHLHLASVFSVVSKTCVMRHLHTAGLSWLQLCKNA